VDGHASQTVRGRFARGKAVDPGALKSARERAGLTLLEVAKGICSKQALSQFEAGKIRPMPETLEKLAERLRVPIEALLASPHDPRELAMRELEEDERWPELERMATKVLIELNITDRTQAVARFYLGRALLERDPAEAREELRAASRKLYRNGVPHLAAEAREWEGVALYYQQDPAALEVARDALDRYRTLPSTSRAVEARMLEHLATFHLQRAKVPEAMELYRQSIEVGGHMVDFARLANTYHGMAIGCMRIGETRKALDYFERAVNLRRVYDEVRERASAALARLENDFGTALLEMGRWERAQDLISVAIDHFEAAGVEAGKTHALLSMGDLKRQQGLLEECELWTGRALELAERLDEQLSLATAYQQLGELRAAQGERGAMDGCFMRALQILDELDMPDRRALAMQRYQKARAAASIAPTA
jgi:tetratricopeptide (TPR) repeat protein